MNITNIFIHNNLYTIWDRSVWIFIDVKFDPVFYRYPNQWRFDLITYLLLPRMQSIMYVNIEREETQRSREFHGKINLHITWEKLICETTQIHIKRLIVYIYMYNHVYGGGKCWKYAFDFQVFLEKYTITCISISSFLVGFFGGRGEGVLKFDIYFWVMHKHQPVYNTSMRLHLSFDKSEIFFFWGGGADCYQSLALTFLFGCNCTTRRRSFVDISTSILHNDSNVGQQNCTYTCALEIQISWINIAKLPKMCLWHPRQTHISLWHPPPKKNIFKKMGSAHDTRFISVQFPIHWK